MGRKRFIAAQSYESHMLQMTVRDSMTSSIITLGEDDSLHKASVTLAVNGISCAPVMDDREHLLGVLSSMDILRYIKKFRNKLHIEQPTLTFLITSLDDEIDDPDLRKACIEISETKVADIMTREVVTIHPYDKMVRAMDIMIEEGVGCLPVVERERVVGVISKKDIVWAIYRDKA